MALDEFTRAYIEAALWSSTAYGSDAEKEDIEENGEGHFDTSFESLGYDQADLAPESLASMEKDCTSFQADNAELLERWYGEAGESPERAGHDFWLTRNHHGAGFWDRWNGATPQGQIGKQLTDAAHAYGESNLMMGDSELIYAD